MRTRFALLMLPLVLLAADGSKADEKKTETKSSATAAPAAGVKLPDGAISLGNGSWRHTDKDGQTWLYRQTPFGLTRTADVKKDAESGSSSGLTATEVGDEVRFERATPFGPATYTRKKDQLTDSERRVWERDCAKIPASKGASAGKE